MMGRGTPGHEVDLQQTGQLSAVMLCLLRAQNPQPVENKQFVQTGDVGTEGQNM